MPFGVYKDFADCVKRNSDKRNPQAYCAAVKNRIEHPEAWKAGQNRMRLRDGKTYRVTARQTS